MRGMADSCAPPPPPSAAAPACKLEEEAKRTSSTMAYMLRKLTFSGRQRRELAAAEPAALHLVSAGRTNSAPSLSIASLLCLLPLAEELLQGCSGIYVGLGTTVT
jgi:hypothetical protein